MKKHTLIIYFLIILTAGISAQGDLLVSPVRVIFEGSKMKEEISLVNVGNDSAVYSVSFLQYRMTKEGNFEVATSEDADNMFADKYLRVFPRQVALGPRESQVVRIQLRRSPDMKPGEYRSHLYFRAEKETKPLGVDKSKDEKLMSVQITPVYGISIPIIIRTGECKAISSIEELRLENLNDTTSILRLALKRTGNTSVYGDLVVDYFPAKGKQVELASVRGVAVYTSIDKRDFSVRLNRQDVTLNGGFIRVRFTTPKDTPFSVLSETELKI
jgi:hypothetical protein